MGHAQENGEYSPQWLHLDCATTNRFLELEEALAETSFAIADIHLLEKKIEDNKSQMPKLKYPRSVSGDGFDTFICAQCKSWSFPCALRILTPIQVQRGSRTLTRNAEVHVGCANAYLNDQNLLETVIANTGDLKPMDLDWLKKRLK